MKTKKVLSILVLIFLIYLFLPNKVLAQPLDCCQLGKTIDFDGVTYTKGYWVGEKICTNAVIAANCPITGATTANCYTAKWGILCLLNAVNTVTDWLFYILVVLTSLLVIFGAFTISTAGGDPGKVSSGRNYILYAMVGLALALLSRAIPRIVEGLVG